MKLCTTTALLSEACDDSKLISGPEAVRRLSEAGYESLDFNFSFLRRFIFFSLYCNPKNLYYNCKMPEPI